MTFGEKIQALRKSRGWSQEQLAEQIGVSRQALSKWENGTAIPDTNNVVQLAKLFGVTTDYLLLDEYGTENNMESAVLQNDRVVEQQEKLRKTLAGGFAVLTGMVWMFMIWFPWLSGAVSVPQKEWYAKFPTCFFKLFYAIEYIGQVNYEIPFVAATGMICFGLIMMYRSNKRP